MKKGWCVVSVIAWMSSGLLAEPYSCGPFLLQPGTDQMTVVIDHVDPVSATLTYTRSDGTGKQQTVGHGEAVRHHIFPLTGLSPDTEYDYRITTGDVRDSGRRLFRTLPEKPDSFRIIAVGDTRSHPEDWRRVAERIYEEEQEALFIIGTGDYPSDGSKYGQWVEQFFVPGRDLLSRVPLWPSIGNHESTREYVPSPPTDEGDDSHYFSLFELPGNERWYRVDYAHLTLLVLDSNSQLAPGHDQYEWVFEQLRASRRRFTVVALHHPPYSSGKHNKLLSDGTPKERAIDQAQRFLVPLFERYGVDLVLAGHNHLYERSRKDNVYYVVTGGGGAPLYDVGDAPNPYRESGVSVYHYVSLDVTGTAMELTATRDDGQVIDWLMMPVSEAARERLQNALADTLIRALHCEASPRSQVQVDCELENRLPFGLRVSMSGGDGPAEMGEEFEMATGASARASLRLQELDEKLSQPAWRGRVSVPVRLRLSATADGLPMAAEVEQEVVIREAHYAVPRLTARADGDLAEWADVPAMLVDVQSQTVLNEELYEGDGDMRATVRAAWSPQALHLAIEVEDDAVVDVSGKSQYVNDSVEIYLDGRPEADREDAYGEYVSQNCMPALRGVGEEFGGTQSWRTDAFPWAVQVTRRGYVAEASIPFELVRGHGNAGPGDTVRFDLMITDRDSEAGEQSHHRLWSTGGASSHTSGYGLLVLE